MCFGLPSLSGTELPGLWNFPSIKREEVPVTLLSDDFWDSPNDGLVASGANHVPREMEP